ncbi:Fe-S cluster assembly protein SufD [Alkalihalobacillus sp. FSL W8-0930]
MPVETNVQVWQDAVQTLSNELNEPKWLNELRMNAVSQVESLELPKPDKTKIEKWNFTSFTHELVENKVVTSLEALPESIQSLIEKDVQNVIVQENGDTTFSKVSDELAKQGVIFTDLRTAVQEHADLLKKYLFTEVVDSTENRLTAINAALMAGGVFVYVPRNVEVELPLQAVYAQNQADGGLFNHVVIVAEDNSSVTYVENYSSTGDKASLANIIAEVHVGANARVSFGAVDNLDDQVTSYIVRRGHVARDGRLEWALGLMNNGNTVAENTTHLIGDGSTADTKSVTVGTGSQKQNITTTIFHHGKNSDGQILKHGVMKESASTIFNGISKIEHGASKSNGEQTERILMLSEKARGDANPILLIDEDDVTAGHAASVGRIDPLQMFYLMSRGIPRKEAERLVIHGFLAPVVNELPIESVKERLREAIERKVK